MRWSSTATCTRSIASSITAATSVNALKTASSTCLAREEGGLDAMFFSSLCDRRILSCTLLKPTGAPPDRFWPTTTRKECGQDRTRASPPRTRTDQPKRQNGRGPGPRGASISMATSPFSATSIAWVCVRCNSRAQLGQQFRRLLLRAAEWNGLNERGRAVIRETNRLGMVINVSHGSDETIAQAIDLSSIRSSPRITACAASTTFRARCPTCC